MVDLAVFHTDIGAIPSYHALNKNSTADSMVSVTATEQKSQCLSKST